MSWNIGKIQLPLPPERITFKMAHVIQKVPVMVERPYLFSQGADTRQLSIEGDIFESSRTKSSIWDNYCEPIKNYVSKPFAYPVTLLDEGSITSEGWASTKCKSFKATGDYRKKGVESLYVAYSDNGAIYRNFTSNQDWDNLHFMSMWTRGSGRIKVTLYNEQYATKTNGYRTYISGAGISSWGQIFTSVSSGDYTSTFSNVGTPTGWDKIRSVVVEPSTGKPRVRFDRMVMGAGFKVTTPRNDYNGIYLFADCQFEENVQNHQGYNYRMNLMDATDYYGE